MQEGGVVCGFGKRGRGGEGEGAVHVAPEEGGDDAEAPGGAEAEEEVEEAGGRVYAGSSACVLEDLYDERREEEDAPVMLSPPQPLPRLLWEVPRPIELRALRLRVHERARYARSG